jgi:TatD DNase family protein
VLETDSPYLTPAPHRGKRNESSYVNLVADKLVDVLDLNRDVVVKETTKNANEIFKL